MQEYYKNLYGMEIGNTEKNGRYTFQKYNEKLIINDIFNKLQLQPKDKVLDIGCGSGILTIPLSYFVSEITANDDIVILENIKKKNIENIYFKDGDFIKIDFEKKYDKIIMYSVLQYIDNNSIYIYIDKLLDLLNLNGIAILGDIPNSDKKNRFINKYQTQKDIETWNDLINNNKNKVIENVKFPITSINFTDELIMEIIIYIRKKGYNCYIYPQINNLPFNKTREDIIIYNSA